MKSSQTHKRKPEIRSVGRETKKATAGTFLGRRSVLLSVAPLAVVAQLGSDDPATLLNSVLGAYFLPQVPVSKDFKKVNKDDYTVEFPKAWVSRPNTGRPGLYVSSFQTSDKMTLEVFDIP